MCKKEKKEEWWQTDVGEHWSSVLWKRMQDKNWERLKKKWKEEEENEEIPENRPQD